MEKTVTGKEVFFVRKTVLITGGSRGIGAELVRAFSAAGYDTAFTYARSAEAAGRLSRETGALAIPADSASPREIREAVSRFLSCFGKMDLLINNAGISARSLFTDVTEEEWNRMLSVNLSAAFFYAQLAARNMVARHSGKMIFITSMWGQTGASCEVAFSATKAGLIGMARAMAKELGPSGICVNCIAPGVIDTAMNRDTLSREELDALCEETPLGRLGTARDVALSALFLAGEGGDFITGQVLSPNGGFVVG